MATVTRALQSILEPPHGNALQACVASITGQPLEAVPNFVAAATGYWAAMQAHAATLNLSLLKVPLVDGKLAFPAAVGTLCIARGASPRGDHGHVIVAQIAADGVSLEELHDPHPAGGGLAGAAAWACFYLGCPQSGAMLAVSVAEARPAAELAAVASAGALAAKLGPALRAAGFDLLAPFQVGWYNLEPHIAKLGPEHKISAARGALAFIVGNSRALWHPFTRWVGQQPARFLDEHADALDEYTRRHVASALAAPGLPPCRVMYAYETLEEQGRAVSVTTAAHVAGLAHYSAAQQRSVHATLGPWIAYRAILVFESIDASALPPPPPPSDPCGAAEWARVSELQAACFAQWTGEAGTAADWSRLVEIVRAFETGRGHAYCDEMLNFHYTGDEAARVVHLRACAARQGRLAR